MILSVPVGMVLINMCQAGAFDYIFNDVEILVEGVLGLHENEEKIQEEKKEELMTETFEKKRGMTLITDSFVCRTLQFQERLEKLLYDIHTEFPEKVYSLELLFEKFSGFLKTDMDDGGRFDALIKAAAELTSQEAPRWGNDRRMAA